MTFQSSPKRYRVLAGGREAWFVHRHVAEGYARTLVEHGIVDEVRLYAGRLELSIERRDA